MTMCRFLFYFIFLRLKNCFIKFSNRERKEKKRNNYIDININLIFIESFNTENKKK